LMGCKAKTLRPLPGTLTNLMVFSSVGWV
jgi:hypothetical protein